MWSFRSDWYLCLELIEAGLRGCDLLCSGLQSPSQIPDDALAVCMEAQEFRNFPWVEVALPFAKRKPSPAFSYE